MVTVEPVAARLLADPASLAAVCIDLRRRLAPADAAPAAEQQARIEAKGKQLSLQWVDGTAVARTSASSAASHPAADDSWHALGDRAKQFVHDPLRLLQRSGVLLPTGGPTTADRAAAGYHLEVELDGTFGSWRWRTWVPATGDAAVPARAAFDQIMSRVAAAQP